MLLLWFLFSVVGKITDYRTKLYALKTNSTTPICSTQAIVLHFVYPFLLCLLWMWWCQINVSFNKSDFVFQDDNTTSYLMLFSVYHWLYGLVMNCWFFCNPCCFYSTIILMFKPTTLYCDHTNAVWAIIGWKTLPIIICLFLLSDCTT